MKILEKGHIIQAALEDYSLNHLAEPELEVVEEHILICPTCQDKLQEVDDFVRAFRMAHQRLAARESGPGTRVLPVGGDWFGEKASPLFAPAAAWFQRPAVWATMALLIGLIGLVGAIYRLRPGTMPIAAEPQAVTLVAQRGAQTVAEAQEGHLALQLDLRGVNQDPLVIEVTSWDGKLLWRRTLGLADATVSVRPETVFTVGHYWVRVRAEAHPALLREFGLRIVSQKAAR